MPDAERRTCKNRSVVVRRLAALLAVVALTAPVLAGCGGSDESATEEWAGSVCSELSSWVSGVEGAIQSLTEGGIPDEEAVSGRRRRG